MQLKRMHSFYRTDPNSFGEDYDTATQRSFGTLNPKLNFRILKFPHKLPRPRISVYILKYLKLVRGMVK